MIGMMQGARTAMPPERLATMVTPTVVAFTDPNDLLSYRLIPSVLDVARARLINVIGSNETTWAGERQNSAIMVGLAERDAHLLAEPEQRRNQQGNSQDEEDGSSVCVLQPEIGAGEADDQKQSHAHRTEKGEVCCIPQKLRPSAQTRNV